MFPAANPGEVVTLSDVMYMQDLTPNICRDSRKEETRIMVDKRDWKTYWITRLADGNCWMTQNLDYDDPDSIRITSTSGTDGGPAEGEWEIDNPAIKQYWDPGEKIVDNSKLTDPSVNTDRHYLVGNYYNWLAATAGTGIDLEQNGQNAASSICPAGWELPESGVDETRKPAITNGSFNNLFKSHGYNITDSGTTTVTEIQSSPFYFMPSGRIYEGNLIAIGSGAYWWSSTNNNSDSAYDMRLSAPSTLTVTDTSSKYNRGYFIRCLVLGS